MLIRQSRCVVTSICMALMVLLIGGVSVAQQPATSLWQLAPANSVIVAGFDGRAENASIQALLKAETPEGRELRLKQEVSLRKAVESFATLFGISLDFAKDIDPWASREWAFVVIPEGKNHSPVLIMASADATAANAALQKLLEPWQRLGEIVPQPDSDFAITGYKSKEIGTDIYASATGPVLAFSPSKTALKEVLQGGGFAANAAGDKALRELSGSLFYAFADASVLKMMGVDQAQMPVKGIAMGASVIDTGAKLRVIGYLSDEGAVMAKQMLPVQPAGLVVNGGIPDPSLIAASLPDLSAAVAMIGMFGGANNPMSGALSAIGGTQISAAMTAALPIPAGVISAMAASEADASAKLQQMLSTVKAMKLKTKPDVTVAGIQTTAITIPNFTTVYLAQIGEYIVLASDAQSLTSAEKAIRNQKPGTAQTETYKETMAALGNSNIVTAYVNLAPVQGVGYLFNGLGVGQLDPLSGSIAKSLEDMKAIGFGVGFDGEAVNANLFIRTKPGVGAGAVPVAVTMTAVTAAVLFPVFESARETARESTCLSNIKQLGLAVHMYAADHDGKLPSSNNWRDELQPYIDTAPILSCPDGETIYAFNKNLSGLTLHKIQNQPDVVLFFEADPSLPNAIGSRANVLLAHDGCGNFAYLDGHVQQLSEVPSQSHWVAKYAAPKPVKKAPVRKPYKSRRK